VATEATEPFPLGVKSMFNVLLLIAGFLIILNPFVAALSLPVLTGIALLIAGVMHIAGAFSSKQQPPSLPY